MGAATVSVTTKTIRAEGHARVQVTLHNTGQVAALATKLTLLNAADGTRILPAYYSDNYVSLLPDETRQIEIEYAPKTGTSSMQLGIRGWNVTRQTVALP